MGLLEGLAMCSTSIMQMGDTEVQQRDSVNSYTTEARAGMRTVTFSCCFFWWSGAGSYSVALAGLELTL